MAPTPNAAADASVAGKLQGEVASAWNSNARFMKRATTLDELEAQLTAITARFQALVDAAGTELCCASPAAGSWSVAQCLEHLNLSSDGYFPVWQQVIANAGPRKTERDAPYRIDFWGRLLSWILEPPPRIRSKTPVLFEPVNGKEIAGALEGFCERQQRVIGVLHRCRGRAIDEVRMASPVDPRIRYSIWSSFVIVATHQRRHLWQAEQAIERLRAAK